MMMMNQTKPIQYALLCVIQKYNSIHYTHKRKTKTPYLYIILHESSVLLGTHKQIQIHSQTRENTDYIHANIHTNIHTSIYTIIYKYTERETLEQ